MKISENELSVLGNFCKFWKMASKTLSLGMKHGYIFTQLQINKPTKFGLGMRRIDLELHKTAKKNLKIRSMTRLKTLQGVFRQLFQVSQKMSITNVLRVGKKGCKVYRQ